MYTQCPDCSTAFRVTAEILKQAAGKVRCGGCGNAFNALDFLSEKKPGATPKPSLEGSLPELKPDPGEPGDATTPKSISAEHSAALLKTLDELAGSDIRIEDTGVEWRVVDEDDEREEGHKAVKPEEQNSTDDTGSIRWFIDDSPTPVDEHLSAEPGEIDAPEIFEDSPADAQMRFDDDTPLPEDFDFDAEPVGEPEPVIEARDDPAETEAAQVDLALGDPEDWEDLLGEVDEAQAASADEEAVANAGELTAEAPPAEEEVLPDQPAGEESLPGVDEQFATQAEAMGIDLSGMHERLQEARDKRDDVPQPAEEETSIDEDLVAAAFETEAAARAEPEDDDIDGESDDETVATSFSEDSEPPAEDVSLVDDDEYEALEAEASEEDVSIDDEEFEALEAEASEEKDSVDADDEVEEDDDGAAGENAPEEEFEFDLEFNAADLIEARDRDLASSTEEDAKLAAELGLDDDAPDDGAGKPEPVFLPESEEEKTVNMMIDQDLLAIAVEDEEGFASTIVQKQRDVDDDAPAVSEATETDKEDPLVETIIMEGEFIRDAGEEEELERARKKAGDPNLRSAAAADVKELPDKEEQAARAPVNFGMVAGIAALVLVLVAQGAHQMRESLIMAPVIGAPLGSLYRAIGRPVTPDWDISGWRFEATKGSTDEDDAMLTIYSRVGNKSAEPLPYPLISVSLTDRYEDIIGSKVLEPGDYLAEMFDPRRPVAPGDTFSAVISIEAPSAEATGFKLNVCYRQAGGKLKCAIDDFK
jgi:predicted Zn finger-like uncharacterized protein